MPDTTAARPYSPGLEGVVAGETSLSSIDGEAGRLLYRGYRIADLVRQASGTARPVRVPADRDAAAAGVRAWHAYPALETIVQHRGRSAAAVLVLGESVTAATLRRMLFSPQPAHAPSPETSAS